MPGGRGIAFEKRDLRIGRLMGFYGRSPNEEDGAMDEIDELFGELEDPRTGNAKLHSLHEILLIALCTVLCGGEGCSEHGLVRAFQAGFSRPVPEA